MDLSNVNERGSVEDSRGRNGKRMAIGGGIGGAVIVLVLSLLGVNPQLAKQLVALFGGAAPQQVQDDGDGPTKEPPKDGYLEFSEKILGSANSVWKEQFSRPENDLRVRYEAPTMKLFSNGTQTGGCGDAPSSVGPFYCPADRRVYLDPTFFDELEQRLGGSKSQFSQAFVITHEVGHHVQNLLGYEKLVQDYRRTEGENAGCRLELQADYLAGVWAHHADKKFQIITDDNDIRTALKTATAIGDDTIRRNAGQKWPNPESFNHGAAEQRYYFFKRGLETGDARKSTLNKFFNRQIEPLKLGLKSGI